MRYIHFKQQDFYEKRVGMHLIISFVIIPATILLFVYFLKIPCRFVPMASQTRPLN